jgi:AcrR family transcriptional regulator
MLPMEEEVNPFAIASRRRGTAQTRRRVAESALTLFSSDGYAATSLQAIADDCGVHVQTIYQAFGTKAAVLAEAFELARAGDDDPNVSPDQWPWAQALVADPDPRRKLARFAAHTMKIAPRAARLETEVRSAARGDDEIARLLKLTDTIFYRGLVALAELLATDGALKPGLEPERAADIIFALAAPDLYVRLVAGRRWPPIRYQRWLAATLAELLLRP